MFEIEYSPDSLDDLRWFRKHEQVAIHDAIENKLRDQPNIETKNRKRLRPDHLTEWELRIEDKRVFYDVDEKEKVVKIAAVGFKEREKLFFRGKEHK